jgi:N-methylhydantoinase B
MERTKCPPWGLSGGKDGTVGRIEVHRHEAEPVVVLKGEIQLAPNDSVRVFTAGGGGYGNPKERPVEEVAADLRDGLITRAAARSNYGVVFDDDLRVDPAATAALRAGEDV